jgi:hypothetical protein
MTGQIQTIQTAQTGQQHYNFYSASGHPSGVVLGPTKSNIWVHEDTGTGDLTFGFMFSMDNAGQPVGNQATVNFRIVNSDTDPYVAQSDDPGEAVESPAGSNAFIGTFNYNGQNSDGIAVSGLSGDSWTIIIDSVDFGNVDDWDAASGDGADLDLTLGAEYRITPAGNTPSGAPVVVVCDLPLIDVYDTTDPNNFVLVGQVQAIQTAQTGQQHYNFYSASGHPTDVNLNALFSSMWVHEDTTTQDLDGMGAPISGSGDMTFGFIFAMDNANGPATNSAKLNFRIVDSDTDPYVSQSDDPGEAVEAPAGSNAFVGDFTYNNQNSDGIAVSGISGDNWTIIIDSLDLGNVTNWYVANGADPADPMNPYADDFELVIGNEYRLTPACATPSGVPVCIDEDDPIVTIDAPAADTITNAGSIQVDATIADASSTTVTFATSGAQSNLGDGGGSVSNSEPLAGPDGQYVLAVSATDECDNTLGNSVTVYKDTAPPVVTVTPTEGTVVGTPSVNLTIDVSDQTQTDVTLDGGSIGTALVAGGLVYGSADLLVVQPVTLASGDIAYSFTVTATDAAGNSTTVVRTITLDNTAPTVTITQPATGDCFGASENPIAVYADVNDDSATTVTGDPFDTPVGLAAGGGTVMDTVTLSEGWNDIEVTATDAFGKVSTDTVSVLLDTLPPTLTVDSPGDGAYVRGTIDFDVDAVDVGDGTGVSQVELFVDGASVAVFSSGPFELDLDTTDALTGLADGTHTLRAEAVDGKGNLSSVEISIVVDNTAPTVTIDDPLAGAYIAGDISFTASAFDATSGLDVVTMLSGGSAPSITDDSATLAAPVAGTTLYFTSVDAAPASDGSWLLSVTAVDAAGNESTASVNVTVDNTLPEKAILSPTAESDVSGTINVTVDVEEANLASVEIFVDGQSQGVSTTEPFTISYDTTQRLDGQLLISAVVTDLAGNVSEACVIDVTIDNISLVIHPETLNLKSKGKDRSVICKLEGVNLASLLPTELSGLTLCVDGGMPVPVTTGFSGDDALQDDDGDGIPELLIKFDRQALIAAVRAGRTNGSLTGDILLMTVKAGGMSQFVLGTDTARLRGN